MARKHLQKRGDEQALAQPTVNNDRFVFAALFKVNEAGAIQSDSSFAPFLLNPNAMDENKAGNWVENSIPGQSDPILQWVSGGARTISFTALVTKDTVHFPKAEMDLIGGLVDTAIGAVGAIASSFAGINIPPIGDIISSLLGSQGTLIGEELSIAPYLDYYRSLMYPKIDDAGVLVASPPLIVLAVGKTLSSFSGRNVVGTISPDTTDLWVTKNVGVRTTKWHPNLTPLEAEVTFQFVQYTMKSRSSDTFAIFDSNTQAGPELPGSASGFFGGLF